MVDKNEIFEKLKEVLDPELHYNIIDLGLIYEVFVDDRNDVEILMTLTTPGCPLTAYFEDMIRTKVKEIGNVRNVDIKLTFDPIWDPSKIQKEEIKFELGLI